MPLVYGFHLQHMEQLHELELLIDLALMLNMLVTFFSAFYTDVNLVADILYIAVPYLRGHFLIDCIANIPGFLVFEQGEIARTLYPLKLLRILKARHFLRTTLEAG